MNDTRIKAITSLTSPQSLIEQLPITEHIRRLVAQTRAEIQEIIDGRSSRKLVVIGPCSIHDPEAALAYAKKLIALRNLYQNELCIIMRVYFEKPRTTIGWKGLIHDPLLDGSSNINLGLHHARQLLLEINALGLPTATEFLDTTIPQYLADLISWAAIGARTTESQIHREMASGLSMPVGFKNGTEGNSNIAIDALLSAKHPHHFLGTKKTGETAVFTTSGNSFCHIILRGGRQTGPNYYPHVVAQSIDALKMAQLHPRVMVDCSHGNSQKNHRQQQLVIDSVCTQLQHSNFILGIMIESHLHSGKQSFNTKKELTYGQSITDACLGWEETEMVLAQLTQALKDKNESTQATLPDNWLTEFRHEIDEVDDALLVLLNKRADLILSIGKLKQQHGLTFKDSTRETEILTRLALKNTSAYPDSAIIAIFKQIFFYSLELQKDSD